ITPHFTSQMLECVGASGKRGRIMAKEQPSVMEPPPLPLRPQRRLKNPGGYLTRMLVFLALFGLMVAILWKPFWTLFLYNPFLFILIFAVNVYGVLFALGQVIRLYREIRWINVFRIADPELSVRRQPVLLAPVAEMLLSHTS